MAEMGSWVLLELGELANLTVMGSVAPSGIVPFSCLMAISASERWSNLMKPTPLERPAKREQEFITKKHVRSSVMAVRGVRTFRYGSSKSHVGQNEGRFWILTFGFASRVRRLLWIYGTGLFRGQKFCELRRVQPVHTTNVSVGRNNIACECCDADDASIYHDNGATRGGGLVELIWNAISCHPFALVRLWPNRTAADCWWKHRALQFWQLAARSQKFIK